MNGSTTTYSGNKSIHFCFQRRVFPGYGVVDKTIALTNPAGKTVLDLCCGPGRWAIALDQRGFWVTGVDTTKFYFDKARAKAKNAKGKKKLVQQTMRDFVRPNTFDLVLNMFTSSAISTISQMISPF